MIGYLKGILFKKTAHSLLLAVGGVGYELECPASTLWSLPPEGDTAELHVLTHVREDAIRLFGFQSLLDKQVFETLIGVSSVGPKLALSLLGPFTGEELIQTLYYDETDKLLSVPGVGQRKVDKIVVELKPKIEKLRELMMMKEESLNGGSARGAADAAASASPAGESDPLFDDSGVTENQGQLKRQSVQKRRSILADLESALLNMGHKDKVVKTQLDWVQEEWNENRLEVNLEVSLKQLLQKQSARLVSKSGGQENAV